MIDPGAGKTHRAYLWTYCSTALQATGWWCSASPRAARAGIAPSSFVTLGRPAGAARWCATTTQATRCCQYELIHSARMNGHDPYAYLRDVLERLPTQPASRIGELLPHRWQARA